MNGIPEGISTAYVSAPLRAARYIHTRRLLSCSNDILSEKFEEVHVSLGRLDFRLGRLECLLAVVLVAIVAIVWPSRPSRQPCTTS